GLSYRSHKGDKELIVTGVGTLNDETSITVRNHVYDVPVTEIAEDAFKGNQTLESIHIGKDIKKIGASAFEGNINLSHVYIDSSSVANFTNNDANLLSAAQTVYVEKSIALSDESYIAKNFPCKGEIVDNYVPYSRLDGIDVDAFYEVAVGQSVEVTIATVPAGKEEGVSFEVVGNKIIEVTRTEKNKFLVEGFSAGNPKIRFTFGNVSQSTEVRVVGLSYSDHLGARELSVTGIGTLTNEANLIMLDEVHGIPVTAIANEAFKGNQTIASVYIGKNIKSIGLSAFENNTSLVDVYIDSTDITNRTDNDAHLLSASQTVYVEKNITVSNESYIAKNFPSKLPSSGNYIPYGRVTGIEVNEFYEA
ncbi:MAG: leucine-rich repeat protein, partial [Treponemataceae bacterium]